MPKGKIKKDWKKHTVTIFDKAYALSGIPTDMQVMCSFHGLCQKLGDTTASMKDYSQTEKSAAIDKVYGNLKAGLWRVPGEAVQTMKKKLTEAKEKATPAELKVLEKLGLV